MALKEKSLKQALQACKSIRYAQKIKNPHQITPMRVNILAY